jgi:hypothetical protein
MSDLEMRIVRAWSALVAHGETASTEAIALRVGAGTDVVRRRLIELRAKGALL